MVERAWAYALIAVIAVHLGLSGAGHVTTLHVLGERGDNGFRWLLALASVVALAAVVVVSVIVAARLVQSRQELDRHLRTIAGTQTLSTEWLWEIDLEGRLTYSSEGVQTLLGYPPESLVGQPALELLYDEPSRRRAEELLTGRRNAMLGWQDVEFLVRHRDGGPVPLAGSAVLVRDSKSQPLGHRGVCRPLGPRTPDDPSGQDVRHRLRRFLNDPDVDMALQPVVRLDDQRIVGVEALARFRDGRGPDQWFREAQECGLGKELDIVAFEVAVALLNEIPEDVYLSVNAGPDLLLDARLRRRLLHSGLPLHRLVIEVTEHAQVRDYAALERAVDALREHRIRFAIDDTGAGYASLNHVLQLRPEIIKLDRGLITGIEADPARRALVTALVLLSLELGATVTGEGIETPAQHEALATLGIDHGQGYLFARPTIDRSQWATWWCDPAPAGADQPEPGAQRSAGGPPAGRA